MKKTIARLFRPVFESLGLQGSTEVTPPLFTPLQATCEDRLKHIEKLGFNPSIIYDCGAFIGKWAESTSVIFPQAHFVLIEPNPKVHDQIHANTNSIKERVQVVAAAVSDQAGRGTLNVWDNPRHKDPVTALAASSLLSHVQGKPTEQVEVRVSTIDAIVEETGKRPDLLKLDLQGGERKALLGASKTLEGVELCVVEFGCLEAYMERTTPRDLMELMYEHGFCLYDIVDLRYRPYDGALAGGDFFFIKRASKLKAHIDYF